jgi:signal transduction histidine kinase
MLTPITLVLISNGLMLTLALGSLFIILWQDSRRELNIYFSLFMLTMMLWASGSLLSRVGAMVSTPDNQLTPLGLRMLEIGFGGACITVYLMTLTITEVRRLFFRSAVVGAIVLLLFYHVMLAFLDVQPDFEINEDDLLIYDFGTINSVLYLLFSFLTLVVIWRNFGKVRHATLSYGLALFSIGQIVGLLSPRLRVLAVAENTSTLAALIISFAIVRSQVMAPLLGRTKQLEVVRDVGLAITGSLHIEDVLKTIAAQAADLLNADSSAIYIKHNNSLVLEGGHEIPERFYGLRLSVDQGVVGLVARECEGKLISNYRQEWKGAPDLPLAFETFGALVSVPLTIRGDVVGVLLVVNRPDGHLLVKEDMHLLELLAPQAAVAINNSQLFEKQRGLTSQFLSARNQLAAVLSSTENPVLAIDRKLRILFANPALEKLIDSNHETIEDINQRHLLKYVARDLLPKNLRQFLRSIHHNGSYVYELSLKKHDYLCHITALEKPTRGWVVVLNDVTKLKEVDRLKSQMVRMTSHDLKNPLSAMIAYLDLLQDDGEGVFTESMQAHIRAIWTQVERMERIIRGILDLEKVQSGAPPLEECDIGNVVSQAFNHLKDQALEKGLQVSADIDNSLAPVVGDPQQLEQVVTNLIENAIKFTPPAGKVTVRVKNEDDNVVIFVEDTGIGIPKDLQGKVFDRYFRVLNENTRDIEGSGLGLSLAMAIIDHHQGRIWLHSEENKGTSFKVTLPNAKSAQLQRLN